MKTIIKLASVVLTAAMFTGCGGGGNGSAAVNTTLSNGAKILPMVKGVPTPIAAGYSIVNSSDDASIDIIVVGNVKTATLTAGSASIKFP
ncbi:MAG: hypothetical protein GQ531_00170 [Sulfurovum sp.]|nr:hypothetical protein [Sulfurovum sp.]